MVCPTDRSVKHTSTGQTPGDWVVVALGSNISPRHEHLSLARRSLREEGFCWTLASSLLANPAQGGPSGQGEFLNQILAAPRSEVDLSARELLGVALGIERAAGRERGVRWGPRTLDVDLLFFGSECITEPGLSVPHPRLHRREFVLAPLAEILPELIHPRLGLSIRELLARIV